MKTVTLLGPVEGKPLFNQPGFDQAERQLSSRKLTVLNPLKLIPKGLKKAQYLAICRGLIKASDAVILIDGWESSKGTQSLLSTTDEDRIIKIQLEHYLQAHTWETEHDK